MLLVPMPVVELEFGVGVGTSAQPHLQLRTGPYEVEELSLPDFPENLNFMIFIYSDTLLLPHPF